MTQIITAVTPVGIVMGADSSVLIVPSLHKDSPYLYTGSHKLFQWESHGVLVGLFGEYPLYVGATRFDEWMRRWHQAPRTETLDIDDFLNGLTADLQTKISPSLPTGGKMGLHIALWVDAERFPGTKIPCVFKVSNQGGPFHHSPMLSSEAMQVIYEYRIGANTAQFPVIYFSDGIVALGPKEHDRFNRELMQLVNSQVPSGNLDDVIAYVRMLINLISELYRISGLPPYVAPPIKTAVSLPSPVSGFSFRF